MHLKIHQIFLSLLFVILLCQTSVCSPTTDSDFPKFDPPINGGPINEVKYFAGDGSDIIRCRPARWHKLNKQPHVDIFLENSTTPILANETTGDEIGNSKNVSFTNIDVKKHGTSITILCKAYDKLSDPETSMDSYSITLCFEENCDKESSPPPPPGPTNISNAVLVLLIIGAVLVLGAVIFIVRMLPECKPEKTRGLEKQLKKLLPKTYDYTSNSVTLLDKIGVGNFGVVYKGKLMNVQPSVKVACKTIQFDFTQEKINFLKEMAILDKVRQNGGHENVVKYLGSYAVNIKKFEIYMILEYYPQKDLETYLVNYKHTYRDSQIPKKRKYTNIYTEDLIRWAKEIATGMIYLQKYQVLHCDLAARNILLEESDDTLVAKINDFGLSKNLENHPEFKNYYRFSGNDARPYQYLSPEVFTEKKLSIQSDIWAYGVLLWEIFSLGVTPYKDMRNAREVQAFILSGGRLERPCKANCRVYTIIQGCWNAAANERTEFKVLQERFAELEEMVQQNPNAYNDETTRIRKDREESSGRDHEPPSDDSSEFNSESKEDDDNNILSESDEGNHPGNQEGIELGPM